VSGSAPLTVSFHPLAAEEYRRARSWYARRSPAAALGFQDAVDRVVARIAADPTSGVVFRSWYRWMRTGRFRYVLYYEQITPTEVMVLAVAHAGRRPGYWLRRTRSP
jgi:plasmid stabilization system protein ParE